MSLIWFLVGINVGLIVAFWNEPEACARFMRRIDA